jgi:hypothetical protein
MMVMWKYIIFCVKLFWSFFRRWCHCLWNTFKLNELHRECSTTNSDGKTFHLLIHCECGKVFGDFVISTDKKDNK